MDGTIMTVTFTSKHSKNCDSGQYFRTLSMLDHRAGQWTREDCCQMSKLSPDIKHSLALSPCLQNVTLCKYSQRHSLYRG